MGRGWQRVRGTPSGVQSWEYSSYQTEVEQADPGVAWTELRHAKQQIALANQYPGRERSLPSGAKVIEIDTGKRSPKT